MYNNSKVAKAIRLAMMFGAASTAAISTSAFSAEEEAKEEVELIEVTGSRIKRADLEGASPVTTISIEQMKLDGNFTVADALRGSSFNSFGSFSERSGSSAQSQATVNLRGAGSNRTLVLLDGKRMPGSPTLGGQAANLNAIPLAVVERIDILTDGASSTYGSDAIAGVINIVLKKNYEGLEFNIGAGQRSQDEGTTSNEFSIITGVSNDKGNITIAFDHQMRKGISDGARDYTKAKAEDLNGDGRIDIYTDETSGWSYYGATVLPPDFSDIQASPLCGELTAEYGSDTFQELSAEGIGYPGGTVCGFAYANVSYNTASFDRNSIFVDANYDLTENIEWFGRALFVQNSSFGRYAPPAAPWANMSADNPNNPYGVDGAYGLFRWVGIGNRDGNVDDYNQDYLMGLRGDFDFDGTIATWETYYHRNVADNKSVGEFYLSYGGLAYNDANGIDLGSDEGIANLKATTLQNSYASMDQYFAGVGFDMFELSGGEVAHYFGFEYMEQTYADTYDGQSEAGLIGGSAGNSAAGGRDITAFFYEAALPVTDTIEVNIAARYDDYSDFGSNVAPKVAVRWQLLEDVVLRASYSEAFRAPGLDELNAATTFSAEGATDYKACAEQELVICPQRQYNTYYKSNPDLGPETSQNINVGLVWDVTDNIGVKVDYYELTIDDVITTKSVQGLLSDEAQGEITAVSIGTDTSELPFYLMRDVQGGLFEAGTGFFNGGTLNINGTDVTFNGNFETSFGDFTFNSINSFIFDYGDEYNFAGTAGAPEYKSVTTLVYVIGDNSFAWSVNYTGSTSENDIVDPDTLKLESDGKLDAWVIHSATYTYDAGSYGAITLQVNNVFDEDPILTAAGTWDDANLYNNFGRDIRASYSISF